MKLLSIALLCACAYAQPSRDIRDFGARCNGSFDDSAAIQAATNAATRGGVITFPVGTCIVGTAILNKNPNVTYRGTGWGSIIKAKDGANLDSLIGMVGSYGAIRNLKFDGNRANGGTSITFGTLIAIWGAFTEVSRVEVTGSQLFGITMGYSNQDTHDITIKDSWIHDNGCVNPTCGDLVGGGSGIIAGRAGAAPRPSYIRITGNRIENNYSKTKINNSTGGIGMDALKVLISENTLIDNYNRSGGQISNMGDAGVRRDFEIVNNRIYRTGPGPTPEITAGIELSIYGFRVVGNDVAGHEGTGACGIALQALGPDAHGRGTVTANVLRSNDYGICTIDSPIKGVTSVAISSNEFFSNTKDILISPLSTNITQVGNNFN